MARYSVLITLHSGRQVSAVRDGTYPKEAVERVFREMCPEAEPEHVASTMYRLIPDPPLGGYTGANLSEAERLPVGRRGVGA